MMKVPLSVRNIYMDRLPTIEALKRQVDSALQVGKSARWHYESRIKQLESFAVKIESGRVQNPAEIEDFLACTIVVPNSTDINTALKWVLSKFDLRYRRPSTDAETTKRADAFPFDDLRLYCVRGNDGSRKEEKIDEVVFEIQVKTFLQHAWGIATHDLSYKTDDVRWGKDRIVAHLKAAIEFAEVSIQQAENLSSSALLQITNNETAAVARVMKVLKRYWPKDALPNNVRGLSETLYQILSSRF